MASVTENKKDGKTVSYKFRAVVGRTEFGKQINRTCTWYAPDNLPPQKARKGIVAFCEEQER